MDECIEVCIKSNGYKQSTDIHRISKFTNLDSYNKLDKHFE
jgi:hypothetical protein